MVMRRKAALLLLGLEVFRCRRPHRAYVFLWQAFADSHIGSCTDSKFPEELRRYTGRQVPRRTACLAGRKYPSRRASSQCRPQLAGRAETARAGALGTAPEVLIMFTCLVCRYLVDVNSDAKRVKPINDNAVLRQLDLQHAARAIWYGHVELSRRAASIRAV